MRRTIIVITAAQQVLENTFMTTIDKQGGDRTFTVGLNALGVGVPTHYWCNWLVTDEQYATFRTRYGSDCFDGDKMSPDEVLAAKGLKRIHGDLS